MCLKRGWPQTKCLLIAGSDAARPGREDVASLGLNRLVPAVTSFRGWVDTAPLIAELLSLAVPRDDFQNPPPCAHYLLSCSLERAVLQLQKSLNCSSPAQNSALAPVAVRGLCGRTLPTQNPRICAKLKNKELLSLVTGGAGHRVSSSKQ